MSRGLSFPLISQTPKSTWRKSVFGVSLGTSTFRSSRRLLMDLNVSDTRKSTTSSPALTAEPSRSRSKITGDSATLNWGRWLNRPPRSSRNDSYNCGVKSALIWSRYTSNIETLTLKGQEMRTSELSNEPTDLSKKPGNTCWKVTSIFSGSFKYFIISQ